MFLTPDDNDLLKKNIYSFPAWVASAISPAKWSKHSCHCLSGTENV